MNFKRSEPILCFFNGNIFDCNWIRYIFMEYRLKRVIYMGFSTFVDGWSEQAMSLDLHVADKALSV